MIHWLWWFFTQHHNVRLTRGWKRRLLCWLARKKFLLDFQDLPALSEYHKKYQQGNTQRLKYHPVIHGNTWWGKYVWLLIFVMKHKKIQVENNNQLCLTCCWYCIKIEFSLHCVSGMLTLHKIFSLSRKGKSFCRKS